MGYGPLIKYGLIVGAIAIFCGYLIYFGSSLKQMQWDAAVSKQQMAAGENIVKNAMNTAAIESRYQQTIDRQAVRVRQLTKEVKAYAESSSQKCELSPEFVRVFDAATGMLGRSADGVPTAGDSTGAPIELSETTATDVAVLEIVELQSVELANLWNTYSALVDWVRSSNAIAQEGAGR